MKKDIRQLKKEEIINYFVDKGEKPSEPSKFGNGSGQSLHDHFPK